MKIYYRENKIGEKVKVRAKHSAMERIADLGLSGHTEGQLLDSVRISYNDPDEGIAYSGYWKYLRQEKRPDEGKGTKK